MKKYLKYFCILFLVLFLINCDEDNNNNDDNGDDDDNATSTAICTASYEQQLPQIIADGAGGAIIVWEDERSDSGDVYAQKVNSANATMWTENGVAICTAFEEQEYNHLVTDGAGGAIIAWEDERSDSGDIYAQRVGSAGGVLWTANGVVISNAVDEQQVPQMASDGAGGAIIVWEDERSDIGNIYAQRINASGNVLWTSNGVPINTASGEQSDARIISDGAGGAIIVWESQWTKIYAQRVNAAGVKQWGGNGVALCTAQNGKNNLRIIPDGSGGAIAVWDDFRNNRWDIYAQHINAAGGGKWNDNGVLICAAINPSYTHIPQLCSDGNGGAIVVWKDNRHASESDLGNIYAQLIASDGTVRWTAGGIAICTQTGTQDNPQIAIDTFGGAVIVWQDSRSGSYVIYAQRINANGIVQWQADGLVISTEPSMQYDPQLISDGSGGAIITWEDSNDIYMRRISSSGI